jgi:superfamily II DNA or RNA helicase
MADHRLTAVIGRQISLPGHFDEPVTLEDARPLGPDGASGFECRVRLRTGSLEETVITPVEAATLAGEDRPAVRKPPAVDAGRLHLLIEATRIRLAYSYDRQFAVSLSGIRTLPHQIEAVYEKMLPQPRLRFLLADDPGAGKTIMAGLLLKEMKLREAVERVLVLCPAPLTIQWQDELLRWFGESFDIIFAAVDQQQLTNPWQRSTQVIASLDYAKQDDVRERIWQQHWDLVILDEAHKCSAYTKAQSGRSDEVAETKRYQLAKRLTAEADHVLLLTATPHHGDEDRFAHFLRLLDPDLFPEPHRLGRKAEALRKDIFRLGDDCPWALRRLKEDLKDLRGHRLFPDRHAVTVPFCLNREEYALYQAVTDYINRFLPNQPGRRKASAALARTVLQRRLASSTCAIHESLKRRSQKQQDLLDELEALPPAARARRLAALQGRFSDPEQDDDDLDDEARTQVGDQYTAAAELDQLSAEVTVLKDLVEQARKVREQPAGDSKLAKLRECLQHAQFNELRDGRGKLLIFTEHRDTLTYLRGHLEQWKYSTCEIHGSMNPHERKKAQEAFRTQAQVCVATEAAGEGINLQFCHLMLNYDMPWNPTRLEQRLGRIHRIGQKNDAYVYNFVATDSESGQPVIEGRILHRLLEKLDQMRGALQGRVFDVIGEVLSLNAVNLPEMLREAAHDPRRLEEYIDQIDHINPERLRQYEEATGIALARAHVDFSGIQRRNLEVEERRLMPLYVEKFFLAAGREVGLRPDVRADGLWRLEYVPADLRSERLQAVRRLGKPEAAYRKFTFHKPHLEEAAHADAVLLGPGHPLYAAVDEKLRERLAGLQGGTAVFADPLSGAPYRLHFFEIAIRGKDTRGNDVPLYGELVAVRDEGGHFEVVPADCLHDLPPHPQPPAEVEPFDVQPATDFLKSTYQMECRGRCQKEREHFARIVREYLGKSFTERINRAQERYMTLAAEAESKPEFKLAADEALRHVTDLERAREERRAGLARLELARTGPVQHLGTALVLRPDDRAEEQLGALAIERDPVLRRRKELAAEEIAIASLLAEGFPAESIERVGSQHLGFDIRASRVTDPLSGEIEARRVEVKGYSRGNPIQLEFNEWTKAQQLGESYWLYVVWEPLEPGHELVRVQDPVRKVGYAVKERVVVRRYEVPAEAIAAAAESSPP